MHSLSIVTINYNNKDGLIKTFSSVFSQKWRDFEYIIIDGGSLDGSLEIIKENANSFSYWCSENDAGIYNAMNKGLNMATGEYILFLNSGDYLVSEHSLNLLQNKLGEADHICFNARTNLEDLSTKLSTYCTNNFDHLFFFKNTLYHPSTVSRLELFKKYGYFDESLKICSDWKFFYTTILKHGCTYRVINEYLSIYDNTGLSSLTVSQAVIEFEKRKVIENEFPGLYENMQMLYKLKQIKNNRIFKYLNKFGFFTKYV